MEQLPYSTLVPGEVAPSFIVKVNVTLTLKRMSQCIVNAFYYEYIFNYKDNLTFP